jgi:uncharacterized membrane protein YccF (DUF307 family)
MSLIMNLIWIVLGGFFSALAYFCGGIALMLTIVGIPWGIQCFKLALFSLFPFGSDTERDPHLSSAEDTLGFLGNIIWFIFGGLFCFLNHLFWGFVLCLSIIGIPFGIQHLKMARLSLTPFGRRIIDIPR